MAIKALQACRHCRRLKRKCSRGLPSCLLCARLGKQCQYPGPPDDVSSPSSSSTIDRIQRLEQLLEHGSPRGTTSALTPTSPAIHDNASTTTINPIFKPAQNFPSAFFLDPAFFSPINDNVLSSTAPSSPSIHKAALVHLGPDGANVVGEYLATVQTWFPIVSKKRLLRPETENPSSTSDGCGPLLLLAMKLCVVGRRDSPIYHVVRSLCAAAETAGVVSLRLVQALILLALFEVAHAIYPGAYLTTGRVARLAALMGMQAGGQEVPRPFRNFDTWTLREEHVRARWAIVILDRYIGIATGGLPLATGEPTSRDVLPMSDSEWEDGRVVPGVPLYSHHFKCPGAVCPYANLCQASHMLGKVLRHIEIRKASDDYEGLAYEAIQLHKALYLFLTALETDCDWADALSALGVAGSASLVLYKAYGRNGPEWTSARDRLPPEIEMQSFAVDGLRNLAARLAPKVARLVVSTTGGQESKEPCVFLAQWLYASAVECAWYIREDGDARTFDALNDILQGLHCISQRWDVGGEYIGLLEQAGVLRLLEDEGISCGLQADAQLLS